MPIKNTRISFSQTVQAEWSADTTVNSWRRWHKKTVQHLQPMTHALLEAVEITSGNNVLDLASGSGEPALTIASIVGSEGRVVATDLSEEMLVIAEENSRGANNIVFQQADAHDLPFAENYFDVVTCRLGVMYFWDCQQALKESLRVLKPGGHAVFISWGAIEENTLARTIMFPFAKRKAPPILPHGAPHPFRFSAPGSLASELTNAGFLAVQEQQKVISCPWPGPPDELWNQVYEMAVPLQPFFDSFDPDERNASINEVITEFGNYYDGKCTDPTTNITIATGKKST